MTPNRPPTEWGERLLTVGLAITIATIGLVGLGLLVSVDHSDVGPTGRAPPPAATRKLESPQIDSGLPSLDLQKRSRNFSVDRLRGSESAASDRRRAESAGDTLEPVATTPGILAVRDAEQCSRLEREIEELDARSRLSVTSADSNRLLERWHRLRNEANNVGCSAR